MICFNGYWCKFDIVFDDIVNCIYIFSCGVLKFVYFYIVVFVYFNISCCKVDFVCCWCMVNCLNNFINVLVVIIFKVNC